MSWSGARSKAASELLFEWTKCVIQAARPWISTRGIGRGSVWFTEINNELRDTSVGIICLTHENKISPWILFEAGALAKGLPTNKVCTFLVDLAPHDIKDPLAQFNHTMPTRDGLMSLAETLNSSLEVPLDSAILNAVFEAFWPKFEKDFAKILEDYPQEAVIEARTESSMLEEVLAITRGLSQRVRMIEELKEVSPSNSVVPAIAIALAAARRASRKPGELPGPGAERDAQRIKNLLADGLNLNETILKVAQSIGRERVTAALELLGPEDRLGGL